MTAQVSDRTANLISWTITLVLLGLLLLGVVSFYTWATEPGKQELLVEEMRQECLSHGHRDEACWKRDDYYYRCVVRQKKPEALCALGVRQQVRGWIKGEALAEEARRR